MRETCELFNDVSEVMRLRMPRPVCRLLLVVGGKREMRLVDRSVWSIINLTNQIWLHSLEPLHTVHLKWKCAPRGVRPKLLDVRVG